ncbi:hypothetical protein [Spirochaeta isovalerica]|uniref:Uncharacterized protein n=1 Tax=Spirochaeta isovalerica TaxID=150 RepID=A0A841RAK4_9SPIO|nr:hypothetical protein [Spirochaeta isovalerica]MBB6480965.1 hypothetical protein [Spirochaeta isovalerica]
MKYIGKNESGSLILTMELQKGVLVPFLEEETVTAFILRVLNLSKDQMEKEVQTLILNNGCVDEPEARVLASGDTLVLSGAMPGLVGAMLRSNSPIKAMRNTISEASSGRDETMAEGFIRLKLFNTVLTDHKEDVLRCGFYIEETEG